MIDIILSDSTLIIFELLVITIMIIFIVKISKEKRSSRENIAVKMQRQKQDRLNQQLMNSKGKNKWV